MANRYVRIYPGANEESNILGFSVSASTAPDHPAFNEFMQSGGYRTSEVDLRSAPKGSMSLRHLEVRPPLSEESVRAFGELCVKIIESGNNMTFVLDNRQSWPEQPFGDGIKVASA